VMTYKLLVLNTCFISRLNLIFSLSKLDFASLWPVQ
jgi:hypothetical protein